MKKLPLLALGIMLLGCTSCETIQDAKSFFQGEAISSTRLEITIEPANNIKIFIDGQLKGKASPYTDAIIANGQHMLKVVAPGYYPIEMPIEIVEGKKLSFPLAMRQLPPAVAAADNGDEQNSGDSTGKKNKAKVPAAGNEALEEEATPAPVEPEVVAEPRSRVIVRLGLDPACVVWQDGKRAGRGSSVEVTFDRSYGKLKISADEHSAMYFTYQLSPEGRLEVRPNGDVGSWRRNGSPVAEKFYFIGLQPQRFEALVGPDSSKQAAIFKIVSE